MPQINFDPQEVNKFSALAARWWDMEGPCKPLHAINPLRLAFIMQHVELTDKNIVDIGCGGGILTESLAAQGAHAMGIDVSEEALTAAKIHAKISELNINYQMMTAEKLTQERPRTFDVVTCMEMLEHVPDPVAIVNACAQLLKPGGQCFFSTLNRNPKSYIYAILGAEYLLKLLPKGTHEYSKFIKPSELARTAREQGLTVANLKGITYSPLTNAYQLCEDISVNYLMHCVA